MKQSKAGVKRATASAAFSTSGGAGLGFEAYRSTETLTTSAVYLGEEESLKLPFKALLTKKDSITRIKALTELVSAFESLSLEVIREALGHWAFLYEICQKDNDRRVRYHAAIVMKVLSKKVPKALGEKRFPSFGADWLCACFDMDSECAMNSKQAFDECNVNSISDVVINRLYTYCRQRQPDEVLEEIGTPEEMQDRSIRIRGQAIQALAFLSKQYSQVVDFSKLNENSNWFKFLLANDNEGGSYVRKASYQLLASIALNQNDLINSIILKNVFRIISEKDRGATPSMWNGLIAVIENCSSLFWDNNMDLLRKGFFPEIFRHFDRRANDAGFSALSSCVVLLSLIPEMVWESYGEKQFCWEWFEKLLSEHNVKDSSIVLAALECIYFLLVKKNVNVDTKAYLMEKINFVLDFVEQNLLDLSPYQDKIVSMLLLTIPDGDEDLQKISSIEKLRTQEVSKSLYFLTTVLKNSSKAEEKVENLFRELTFELIAKSLQRADDNSSEKQVCSLIQAKPIFFKSKVNELIQLFVEKTATFERNPKLAAMIVKIDPETTLTPLVRVVENVQTELFPFLSALYNLHLELKPNHQISEFLDKQTEETAEAIWDGDNEIFISKLLNEDMIVKRLNRALKRGTKSLEEYNFSQMGNVLKSLACYEKAALSANILRILPVILEFSPTFSSRKLLEVAIIDSQFLIQWLNFSPENVFNTEELEQGWARLLSKTEGSLIALPKNSNCMLSFLEMFGIPATFYKLKDFFSVWEEMILWMFKTKTREAKKEMVQLDDSIIPYIVTNKTSNKDLANETLEEFLNLIPEVVIKQNITNWCFLSISAATELSQSRCLRILLNKRDELMNVAPESDLSDALQKEIFQALDLITSSTSISQQSTPALTTPSPAPSPTIESFKPGDAVIYNKIHAATVIARHDDGDETYYTVRWWGEDRSRETQTTGERLESRKKVTSSQSKTTPALTEQEISNAKQLEQVQKLLQEARMTGNRQESIRLMKLQAELTPKPKDTDEEKAKLEAERLKTIQEKRELNKKRQETGDEDVDANEIMEEEVKSPWNESIRKGLNIILRFAWRNSSKVVPFKDVELEAIQSILQDQIIASLVLPSSPGDLELVCNLFANFPDFVSQWNKYVSNLLLATCSLKMYRNAHQLCTKFPSQLSEKSCGNLLNEFASNDECATICASVMPNLRFPARLVWDLAPQLFAKILKLKEVDSNINVALASFVLLHRYPTKVEPTTTTDSNETVEEETDVSSSKLLTSAKSCFPDFFQVEEFRNLLEEDLNSIATFTCRNFLLWLLLLRYVLLAWKVNPKTRESIGAWLRKDDLVYRVLSSITHHLAFDQECNPVANYMDGSNIKDDSIFVSHLLKEIRVIDFYELIGKFSGRAFFQTVHVLPALVREWWADHLQNRFDKEGIYRFTSNFVTPNVLKADMVDLNEAIQNHAWDPSEMTIKMSLISRVVTICSFKDDTSLEMEISFPEAYPLLLANVECTKQIGVRPEKWKRWALQIVLLTSRDGTLADAVQLWKENLDKEFEGVEPCPICYSVLHATDSSLPRLTCKTCKNVFHGKCLAQWFKSSHQSLCPLCKQSFMANKE